MTAKKTINLAVSNDLLERFNESCSNYGHAKQKGMVLSAALQMFLDAPPETQGEYLRRVISADIDAGVKRLENQEINDPSMKITPGVPRLAKAAKKRGITKKSLKKLPRIPD